nr:uncharacterized protein CTRU02_10389 [Colletotrichum truncatum]KAF6787126.1 hypothetical protein CTRU02_10389 [Colletotrichum truncatum]
MVLSPLSWVLFARSKNKRHNPVVLWRSTEFKRHHFIYISPKRALGGFVVSGTVSDSPSCSSATVYNLILQNGNVKLLDNGKPISYSAGDTFKEFRGSEPPPAGSSTDVGFATTASGTLVWSNADLPYGQAGFCQSLRSGQLFVTFTSEPPDCIPVVVNGFDANRCENGQIVGFSLTSDTFQQTQASNSVSNSVRSGIESTSSISSKLSGTIIQPTSQATAIPTPGQLLTFILTIVFFIIFYLSVIIEKLFCNKFTAWWQPEARRTNDRTLTDNSNNANHYKPIIFSISLARKLSFVNGHVHKFKLNFSKLHVSKLLHDSSTSNRMYVHNHGSNIQ